MYPFLKLNLGSNRIRLMSLPYSYYSHPKLISADKSYHEQKLKCVRFLDDNHIKLDPCHIVQVQRREGPCPICDTKFTDHPPATRWMFVCVSLFTNKTHLLDLGHQEFSQIRNLVKIPEWRVPLNYDLDIYIDDHIWVIPIPNYDIMTPINFDKNAFLDMCIPNEHDLRIMIDNQYKFIGE